MEKPTIIKDQYSDFAEFFLKSAMEERNFGSMNKNDYEVLLFHLLRKYGNLKDKSNFKMSRILRMSETKVKRLAYESQLIYEYNESEETTNNRIAELIAKSSLSADGKKIQFAVEDSYLRKYIGAKLKDAHMFCDFALNSEVIVINMKAFAELVNIVFYSEDDKKKVLDCAKWVVKNEIDGEVEIADIFEYAFDKLEKTTKGDIFSVITSAPKFIKMLSDHYNKNNKCKDKSIPNNYFNS